MCVAITSSYVFASSHDSFFVWHFRTAQSWTTLRMETASSKVDRGEKIVNIDGAASDPICCIAASERILVKKFVGRQNGESAEWQQE